eukprot:TRINITY_DN1703_c0_g1_i1.p1 TRINITY_DN1703_c0_g1~~TRINITY_DN1703_c0_g1_i1.p1  ORF type:complete len:683 (-),score=159.69 TRINITY_DN1703_c0_g1_i1:30-2078(-)
MSSPSTSNPVTSPKFKPQSRVVGFAVSDEGDTNIVPTNQPTTTNSNSNTNISSSTAPLFVSPSLSATPSIPIIPNKSSNVAIPTPNTNNIRLSWDSSDELRKMSSSLPEKYKSQLPGWSESNSTSPSPNGSPEKAIKGSKEIHKNSPELSSASVSSGVTVSSSVPKQGPHSVAGSSVPVARNMSSSSLDIVSPRIINPLSSVSPKFTTPSFSSSTSIPTTPLTEPKQPSSEPSPPGNSTKQEPKGKQQNQQQGKKQQQQKQQQGKSQQQQQQQPPADKTVGKEGGSEKPQSTPDNPSPASTPLTTARKTSHAPPVAQYDDPKQRAKVEKKKILPSTPSTHQVPMFAHLPQYERGSSLSLGASFSIHPAILELGLKYADFTIMGSNARAVAMMTAFKQVINDFNTPPTKTFPRELDSILKPLIQFLIDCRPMSISMGNAINYLKLEMGKTSGMTDPEAKEFMYEKIDGFVQERVVLADTQIAAFGSGRIIDGDVVLTYARSHVVELILLKAHQEGKNFRVIVVDSCPKREGRQLLCSLASAGLKCTYTLLSGISYIMKEVNKVIVGAYSLLSNGALVSRVGTAVVASVAHAFNVPLIVSCETYKFTERVQLDAICFNQLGDPDELQGDGVLKDWRNNQNLKLLNLMYDLTPMEYISMVITEVGMIPPTSVPVILRENRKKPML